MLFHLVCVKYSFGWHWEYEKEIYNTNISPIEKWDYETGALIAIYPDANMPKWYKGWMRKIEEPIANKIFNYLLKNKDMLIAK